MKKSLTYVVVVCAVFMAMAIVMDMFPRSKYSELEQRDLTTFPEFSFNSLFSGEYTAAITSWFSDTEPYRDRFMKLSMQVKDARKMSFGDEQLTFHAPEQEPEPEEESAEDTSYVNENAKLAHSGIIVCGKGDRLRAMMSFAGYRGKGKYADAMNAFAAEFAPDSVQVYCMLIPSAACFYTPNHAKGWTKPQQPAIDSVYTRLDSNVIGIQLIDVLRRHSAEPIYLRTDHHWSPLGAFYAARTFAQIAKVPFKGLEDYHKRVVKNYVGSMYGYSKDVSVKNSPEDFVFYVPKDSSYTTEYIRYKINSDYKIEREYPKTKGEFFYDFPDGSGNAYCTFMGSDGRITEVTTNVNNGRRLMILKDSFGNPIPGYLFSSFEKIVVLDYRYFNKSVKDYVRSNGITDILFANTLSKGASTDQAGKAYLRMLARK